MTHFRKAVLTGCLPGMFATLVYRGFGQNESG